MDGLQYLEAQLADYQLIDCGGFEKLERFGRYVVRRPEPQAIWQPSLPAEEWVRLADATFLRDARSDERGSWQRRAGMPERWEMDFRLGDADASRASSALGASGASGGKNLRLRLALTGFKHVGVFPEQAENWRYIYNNARARARGADAGGGAREVRVLNLFAYTGGATLAARAAGAVVTHVDAVKQTVSWARNNLILSELASGDDASGASGAKGAVDGVRWMVDDAMKFVRREVRRGAKYDGIVLDPPAYGRGPEGEKWVLEQGLDEMLALCAQLLDNQGFMVLNLYSMGVSALVARTAVRSHFGDAGTGSGLVGTGSGLADEQFGELFVTDRSGKNLPLGVYYRFSRG